MRFRFIIVVAALLVAGSAYADDQQLVMLNKHDFIAMKSKVTKEFDKGDRYREIQPEDQKKVLKALDRMDARWQKAEDESQLSPNDRIEMVNDEQLVNNILEHAAADSRLVCHREQKIGSHFPVNVCRTVAQQKHDQEKAQDAMRRGDTGTN